jgi:putative hydrolase of the HAD superfamily
MDYDSTLHDMDTAMEQKLHGILGLNGKELYKIWVYDIHRAKIHRKYLEKHDDIMFHCRLLFEYLDKPFDDGTAKNICNIFDEAKTQAKMEPIYYPETIKTLDKLKEKNYSICLSTGYDAKEKAETLERITGKKYFSYIFSETILGVLKTETKYYEQILEITSSLPSELVSVGDTPLSDIRPAKLVGINTIWVNRVNEPQPEESDQIPDFEVENLIQIVDIIESLG